MTFFDSVKRQFQNGNIAKWTMGVGQATLGIGMTGAIIHDLNHSSCHNNFSIFSPGCFGGCSPFMGTSMMGMGMMGTGMMGMPLGSMYGGYDPRMTAMGLQMAEEYGRKCAEMALKNSPTNELTKTSLPKTNNEYAGDLDPNQDTSLGKAFDEGTDSLVKDSKPIEGKELEIIDEEKMKDKEKRTAAYTEIGKSYGAFMDADKDGKITAEEFINHETNKLDAGKDYSLKLEARRAAQIAFNKMDQNGDKKLDYKELAATIATFESNDESKLNGKIESENYAKWSKLSTKNNDLTFDKEVRKNYNFLFNKDS